MDQLAHTLVHSREHKERIGAAVSLGRLADRRSMGALIKALGDEHRTVRALAATALGKIGDPKALPALERATKDSDELVRQRAQEAIDLLSASQRRADGDQAARAAADEAPGTPAAAPSPGSRARNRTGKSKDKGAATPQPPAVYISVQSAADKSPQAHTQAQRRRYAVEMRRMLAAELMAMPEITTNTELATTAGISRYNIDASITSFTHQRTHGHVEIGCEIRIAVSDERGKLLSFFTGRARVQVPQSSFDKSFLPQLRLEALENAVKSVHQGLRAHLGQHDPS